MGQQEILDLMRKHYDYWFNAEDLSKHFFIGKVSVNRCLLKLYKYKLVFRQKRTFVRNKNSYHFFEYKVKEKVVEE